MRALSTARQAAAGRVVAASRVVATARAESLVPETIGGLSAWWDINAGLYQSPSFLSVASVLDDPVGGWVEKFGRHYAIQGTAAAKPLFKTGVQNGLPMLLFDGSNDGLIMATAGQLLSGIDIAHSWGVVFKFVGTTGTTCLLGAGRTTVATPFSVLQKVSGFQLSRRDDVNMADSNPIIVALDTNTHFLLSTFDGSLNRLYLDGVNIGSDGVDVGQSTFDTGSIGCLFRTSLSQTINGYIGEVFQYDTALTASQASFLWLKYVKPKWGL